MFYSYETRSGDKYRVLFDPKLLESTAIWDPITGEAPISVHQAVALAIPSLKSVGLSLGVKNNQARLEEIRLEYFGGQNMKLYWFYVITFREHVDFLTMSAQDSVRETRIPVIVLMNGKVIPVKHEGRRASGQ